MSKFNSVDNKINKIAFIFLKDLLGIKYLYADMVRNGILDIAKKENTKLSDEEVGMVFDKIQSVFNIT